LIALGEKLEKIVFATKFGIATKREKKADATALFYADEPVEPEDFFTPAPEQREKPETSAKEATKPTKEATESDEKKEEPTTPEFTANGDLELVDVSAQPEVYQNLLEREKKGEIELIRRYRRSYESRLIQSKDPMQDYYSGLKNALLRYKGVKSRVSWANETFHQGRNHLAKIIVKTSCLYIYLSVDPKSLKGTKFESAIEDVSGTKKFVEFPTVVKIKGERKYKYALELIDRICAENLSLPLNKKFVEADYRRPAKTDEELAEEGLVKLLVAVKKNDTK